MIRIMIFFILNLAVNTVSANSIELSGCVVEVVVPSGAHDIMRGGSEDSSNFMYINELKVYSLRLAKGDFNDILNFHVQTRDEGLEFVEVLLNGIAFYRDPPSRVEKSKRACHYGRVNKDLNIRSCGFTEKDSKAIYETLLCDLDKKLAKEKKVIGDIHNKNLLKQ
ncbi:hypothetical protein [Marinagarivorans algicola]|uniref:hypothetical protein n=1 Tax=Marinagarivorans algicola TaxID=1513270 RepID=UPI0006B94DC4|nr:hypothetical protein [Marinagarivorans algicola]